MFCREYVENLSIDDQIYSKYSMKDIVYFDIETTGFDKEQDKIVLISLGKFIDESSFAVKQYFAEGLNEEGELLKIFGEEIKNCCAWCSYNGIAFDEPFIKRRMEVCSIQLNLPKQHVDLYRLIRPYHKQLGMERCNLKTVEKYIGIEREDKIDGGISVQLYYQFLSTNENQLRELMMLHNYEDVLNLPKIYQLVHQVINDCSIVRENCVTEKQLRFLKILFKKNSIDLNVDLDKISKKAASRLIDALLKKEIDEDVLLNIINNSY